MTSAIKTHTFISYSRKDEEKADWICKELYRRCIECWRDQSSLKPGSKDWEKRIREAIAQSFALVYIASPHSTQSSIIAGELLIAKSIGCSILPVLIEGDWVTSSRIEMADAQYTDLRDSNCEQSLTQLCDTLLDIIGKQIPEMILVPSASDPFDRGRHWDDHKEFLLPDHNYALIKDAFDIPLQTLLDNLYPEFMTKFAKPFTYGSEWVITIYQRGVERVVQSWDWLDSLKKADSLGNVGREWRENTSLSDFIILSEYSWDCHCNILTNLSNHTFIGVAFPNRDSEAYKYFTRKGEKLLWGLIAATVGARVDQKRIDEFSADLRYILLVDQHYERWGKLPESGEKYLADNLDVLQE